MTMGAPDHTAPHEVRLAYQRGYEKGYDAGFDAGARDWHPLRNMLLTDPETGEPMFICGKPEPDVLGLTRFKVAGTKGRTWTVLVGLREGWLTAEQRMENIQKAVREDYERRMPTEQQIDEIVRWPLQAFDTPEEVARAVARAAYSFAMGEK